MNPSDLLALMPFAKHCGLALESVTSDEVTGGLDWAPERCTAGGILHGGILMTLADSMGALCAFQHLPPGATTATIESKTNFFRPVGRGRVRAVTRLLHRGRATIVVQTDLTSEDGKRVAQVTQTQAVIAS
jgi:uncharacterized protein (TIGR00369 family)